MSVTDDTGADALLSAAVLSAADERALANRRYGVQIGGQRLLLDGSGSVRVMDPPEMFRIPNTYAWCLGLANVRGALVPVYDLAEWQSLSLDESPRMMLVVGDGDGVAATLVDGPPRHLLVPGTRSAIPALSDGFATHAVEAYSMDDGIWTALDWEALFDRLRTLAVISE